MRRLRFWCYLQVMQLGWECWHSQALQQPKRGREDPEADAQQKRGLWSWYTSRRDYSEADIHISFQYFLVCAWQEWVSPLLTRELTQELTVSPYHSWPSIESLQRAASSIFFFLLYCWKCQKWITTKPPGVWREEQCHQVLTLSLLRFCSEMFVIPIETSLLKEGGRRNCCKDL